MCDVDAKQLETKTKTIKDSNEVGFPREKRRTGGSYCLPIAIQLHPLDHQYTNKHVRDEDSPQSAFKDITTLPSLESDTFTTPYNKFVSDPSEFLSGTTFFTNELQRNRLHNSPVCL